MTKTPVTELAPHIRNKNFKEVVVGYSLDEAVLESQRCLECKNAQCMNGCPVGVNIPAFIHHVKAGDIESAYEVLTQDNSLPAICGRVCPQENQCEGKCVRAIKGESVAIGRLEGFVADYIESQQEQPFINPPVLKTSNKKVAVIGSGPAGLTCASELAKAGISVTLFEALHKIGGVLTYGIQSSDCLSDWLKKSGTNLNKWVSKSKPTR
jgi:glutamate synthase (NADPH/NADH) small chain